MITGAQTPTAGRNPGDVLSAAKGLHDLIDGYGEWNDREGRIAEPVVDALYESGAVSAWLFRDVHGATQHVSSSAVIMRSAGRELAGLAEGERWVHFALRRR